MPEYTDSDIKYAKIKSLKREDLAKLNEEELNAISAFVEDYEANNKRKRVVQGAVEGSGAGAINRALKAQVQGWQKVYGDTPEGYGQYVKELFGLPLNVAGAAMGIPAVAGGAIGAGLALTGLDVPLGKFLNKNKGVAVASEVLGVIGGGKAIPTAFKQPLGMTITRQPLSRYGQMAKEKGVRVTQSSENLAQGSGNVGRQAQIASDVQTRPYHQQFMEEQAKDLQRVAEGMTSQSGKTKGEAFGSASDIAQRKMSRLYAELEKSEKAIGDVVPNKAGAIASKNLDAFLASNDVPVKGFKPLRKQPTLSSSQINAVKEIQNKTKNFQTPEDFRRFLRYEFDELYAKKIFDVAPSQMKESVAKMRQVRSALLNAMYETIPDAKVRAKVKKARDAYHDYADSILMHKDLEAGSVDKAFQSGVLVKGLPAIKEAKKLYGEEMVADLGVNHLIEEATKTGTFNFDAFKRAYDAMGKDRKMAVFGKKMKDVDDFISLGEYAQGKKLFEATGTTKGTGSQTEFLRQHKESGAGGDVSAGLLTAGLYPLSKMISRAIKEAKARRFLNAGVKGKLSATDISLPYTGRMAIAKGVEGASAPFEDYITQRMLEEVEKRKQKRNKTKKSGG